MPLSRSLTIKIILSIFLFILTSQGLSFENNTVVIQGIRKNRYHLDLPSNNTILRPQSPSHYQLSEELKKNTSIKNIDTGDINPNTFSQTKIRAQDSANTEIWLDDFLIFDPNLNSPLIFDLDLQSFDRIEIYQGFSPASISSLNSFGLLKFRKGNQSNINKIGFSSYSHESFMLWYFPNVGEPTLISTATSKIEPKTT